MLSDHKVSCVAILAITLLEVVALLKDIDGVFFSLVIAVIALIAGVEIRPWLEKKKFIS